MQLYVVLLGEILAVNSNLYSSQRFFMKKIITTLLTRLSLTSVSFIGLPAMAAIGDNVLHIDLAESTKQITVDEARSRVFIPDTASNTVRVLDLKNLSEMNALVLNAPAYDVAISDALDRIYITLGDATNIAVFDASTMERLDDIVLPETGYEVVADDNYLYVSAYESYSGVMRVDLASEQYDHTFKGSLFTYNRAMLALSPDSSKLYVANAGVLPLSLGVFDLTGVTPSLMLKNDSGVLGSNGASLSVDPVSGNYVSVAATGGNTDGYDTYVLNAQSLDVVSQLDTDSFPRAVSYSKDGESIYTAHGNDSILKWDTESAEVTQTITITGQAQVMSEAYGGSYLIVGNKSNAIDVYEIATPELKLNTVTTGIAVQEVVCYNTTSKQKIIFTGGSSNIADCVANGLVITSGDKVRVDINGEVE